MVITVYSIAHILDFSLYNKLISCIYSSANLVTSLGVCETFNIASQTDETAAAACPQFQCIQTDNTLLCVLSCQYYQVHRHVSYLVGTHPTVITTIECRLNNTESRHTISLSENLCSSQP